MNLEKECEEQQEMVLQIHEQQKKENLGLVLRAAGGLVTNHTEKAVVLSAFFALNGKTSFQESQVRETRGNWPVSL